MSQATENRDDATAPDSIAQRMFFLTLAGVVAYIAVVIALLSTAD